MSASGSGRRIMGMSCGQVVLLLILLIVACAAISGGAYWVLTNPDFSGGPALPTAFQVNSPAPPTRTPGPVVLPPTWTLTPSPTFTATPEPSETPTATSTETPPTGSPTATSPS
ncbi:MAG: hypothetical protein WBZ24_05710 [Anaerolineales bacterium]